MKRILLLALFLTACLPTQHITTITKPVVRQKIESINLVVCGSYGLNIRDTPGTDGIIVGTLQDGDVVTLTGDVARPVYIQWYRIEQGWVSSKYLCSNNPQSNSGN